MDSLLSLRLFTRVMELGSFSAAAREERVSQPTTSKVIAALERDLGVRLLDRTTTGLTATDEGKRFYTRSKNLLEEYADAIAEARGQTHGLTGLLRVHAPVGLGELRLNGLCLDFLTKFPNIDIELLLSDRVIDLVEEGVDVAIRLGGNLPPNVVARKIGRSPRLLVASPEYLASAPKLERPEDLDHHEYIRFAGLASTERLEFANGHETVSVSTRGRYCVNSSLALRACFISGAGLGSAPAWLVRDQIDAGVLVHLLANWTLPSQALHLVYPSRRYQPLRTKTFLEYMSKRLPGLPGFD